MIYKNDNVLIFTGNADDLFYDKPEEHIKGIKLVIVQDDTPVEYKNLVLDISSYDALNAHPEIESFLGKKIKITIEEDKEEVLPPQYYTIIQNC